jgi:membrane associated rhomboid family serine protease
MSATAESPLEEILKQCASRAPEPWYPQDFGASLPREKLDPLLDELRLGGLVRLTDWVQGKGQGYALTPAGAAAVRSPSVLARLRRGEVPRAKPEKLPDTPERASMTFRRLDAVRRAIDSPARPVVTMALVYLNIAVFVFGCFLSWQRLGAVEPFLLGDQSKPGVGKILDDLGSISAQEIFPGQQWWRLLTNMFVHIGVLHILLNCAWLWMLGRMLENLWGRWNYLAIYLVSGLCGGFTVVAFGRSAAGASGALFGIIASLGVWYFMNRRALDPDALRYHSRRFVSTIVIMIVFTLMYPNVSIEGHFGGGIAGVLAAFPVDYARFHKGWRRYLAYAALPFLVVAFFSFFLQTYAAKHQFELIRDTEETARRTFLEKDVQRLLNAKPEDRRSDENVLATLDEARHALRTAYAVRWVRHFGDAPSHEKIDAGNEVLGAWLTLFDRLRRLAEAPQQWTEADTDELKENVRHMVQVRRRYRDLLSPKKEEK